MDPSPFREKELPGYCFAGAWWAIRQGHGAKPKVELSQVAEADEWNENW